MSHGDKMKWFIHFISVTNKSLFLVPNKLVSPVRGSERQIQMFQQRWRGRCHYCINWEGHGENCNIYYSKIEYKWCPKNLKTHTIFFWAILCGFLGNCIEILNQIPLHSHFHLRWHCVPFPPNGRVLHWLYSDSESPHPPPGDFDAHCPDVSPPLILT